MNTQRKKAIKILSKRYTKEYLVELKNDIEQFNKGLSVSRHSIIILDPDDIFTHYVLIFNIKGENDEFNGAEYIMELKADDNFPFTSPTFKILTPNGVYDNKSLPCIEIGHEHQNNSIASLGMIGFSNVIIGTLIDYHYLRNNGGGRHILQDISISDIKQYSKQSIRYNNQNYSKIISLFKQHLIETGANTMLKTQLSIA